MYEVGFECYNILNFNFFYHNEISFIESLDADNHYVLFHVIWDVHEFLEYWV